MICLQSSVIRLRRDFYSSEQEDTVIGYYKVTIATKESSRSIHGTINMGECSSLLVEEKAHHFFLFEDCLFRLSFVFE